MLQGAPNFRPIAGLKSDTIYRSNELSELTDRDLDELKRLKIRTIIDLRTPNERKSQLDRITSDLGIQQISIPILQLNQDVGQFKLLSYLFQNAKTLDFQKYIKDFYTIIAYERTQQLKRTLTILADPNNVPAIIHCTVGKDRTGFIAALLQKLAKVPDEVIIEDYLKTNELMKDHVKKFMRYLRFMSLYRISKERMLPLFQVQDDYLKDIINDVEEKHQTIENYLLEVCQIEKSKVETLKKIVTP